MTNMQQVTRALSKATKQERKVQRSMKLWERGAGSLSGIRRVEVGTFHTAAKVARFV